MKRKRIIFGWMKLTEGVGYVGERERERERERNNIERIGGKWEEMLNEDGRGLDWMKEVRKIRELRQGVGKQKE